MELPRDFEDVLSGIDDPRMREVFERYFGELVEARADAAAIVDQRGAVSLIRAIHALEEECVRSVAFWLVTSIKQQHGPDFFHAWVRSPE